MIIKDPLLQPYSPPQSLPYITQNFFPSSQIPNLASQYQHPTPPPPSQPKQSPPQPKQSLPQPKQSPPQPKQPSPPPKQPPPPPKLSPSKQVKPTPPQQTKQTKQTKQTLSQQQSGQLNKAMDQKTKLTTRKKELQDALSEVNRRLSSTEQKKKEITVKLKNIESQRTPKLNQWCDDQCRSFNTQLNRLGGDKSKAEKDKRKYLHDLAKIESDLRLLKQN
jgi:hypothetical protein